MRVSGIILFLVCLVAPVPLVAQQSGGGTRTTGGASTGSTFGESYGGVENVSAQAAGTFIGGGRPTAFVGTTEIYATSSARATSTSRQAAPRTTVRPASTATQRQATMSSAGRNNQTGSTNNQTIRSASSLDFDFVMPPQRVQLITAAHLNRVPGIQDSQITFISSPNGTTAVLTGTVASDRERRVAQQLLMLEPGIHRVENRLDIR